MTRAINVLKSAMRPGRLVVMADKVRRRLEPDTRVAATQWARERAVSLPGWCAAEDERLWTRVVADMDVMAADARKRLSSVRYDLGGGGAYPLLAFLVRQRQPEVVVESGVAAGWSSRAILESMVLAGRGTLYSSDFPYFRIADGDRYVGWVVPDQLRQHWILDTRGDRVALPAIVARAREIHLVHYDSDKTYGGRKFAMECLAPALAPSAVIVMDDIQDNLFFAEWVEELKLEPVVFEFEGKYLGLVSMPR